MIELEHVSKRYGETQALNDVSFSVQKGEIIGFVGPNGAGKSTAMKIITTYTAPSEGSVCVGGFDVVKDPLEVRRQIGYLPERVPLYEDMLVTEYLEFIGEARHLNGKFKQRFDFVVDACGLESVLKRKIAVLSKGFRQRTCLAQALIHDPDVLVLDEPTSGLDPIQIIGIRNLIKDLAHSKTIILSTHILSEVATIADRIFVINQGRLVGNGTFDELVNSLMERGSIYVSAKATKTEFDKAVRTIPAIQEIVYDSGLKRGIIGAHIYHDPKEDLVTPLNEVIHRAKWTVLALQQERLSLEESFIRLTQTMPEAVIDEGQGGGA
ncbi:ATP-binding cassette domain-containing protein [bacterium]|nr:ATP-binding cassette domain-containing protein [bacterium]